MLKLAAGADLAAIEHFARLKHLVQELLETVVVSQSLSLLLEVFLDLECWEVVYPSEEGQPGVIECSLYP